MAPYSFILCALFLSHGAWSSPALTTLIRNPSIKGIAESFGGKEILKKINEDTTTGEIKTKGKEHSFGTDLSNNMNDNLLKVMDNMRTGAVQLSTPVVKFGADTIPSLLADSFKTMTGSASKIVSSQKTGLKSVVNGAASAVGGGAVLSSAIVGGNMQVVGSGLGVVGNLIDAAARFGLRITGNLADTTALSNKLFATITNDILTGVGDGLNVVGDGVSIISKGSAKVIDAIGHSISKSISNAQGTMAKWFKNGSAKFQGGTMTLTTAAQVNYYNALQWYLHNLMALEGVMDKLTESIDPSGKTSSGSKAEKVGSSTDSSDVEHTVTAGTAAAGKTAANTDAVPPNTDAVPPNTDAVPPNTEFETAAADTGDDVAADGVAADGVASDGVAADGVAADGVAKETAADKAPAV